WGQQFSLAFSWSQHIHWVSTATHGSSSWFAKGLSPTVVLGAHSLSKQEPTNQTSEVEKFIPFSRFLSDYIPDDIMLIRQNPTKHRTRYQVTGWGATNPDLLNASDSLQEVTVTVICRKKICNSQRYCNHDPVITKDMVCAGNPRGQRDSCQGGGDSGGPFVCKGIFHAIVSWGHKCGITKKPGINILLTKKYQTWIKSKLAPSSTY
uniref:Granzyme K n=1 Tax=Jaculus jaculus TaxID=51337 RepID=A0A8C5LIQ2_JACJA